ncbi:MAG: Wzz/FepE/Etk N-terminal domain-containing protein [Rhodobacterales bacterium]|mgnify:CR=1 FL=1|nr:Wzz/FepE/Etk N-terminal domain-containing protein [Rhodobacterales bacterium]MDX5500397.1 Wzz/FepE/Etk N-terminal domain-containing protein [Rhodobacterales bacterium]
MGNIQSIADVLDMIRRRLVPILAVVLLGSLITLFVALQLPRTYEAAAVLQVELPRVAADVTTADAVSHSSQRLQLLEQELTSRDSMLAMIEAHGLYTDLPALSPAEKVVLLRKAVRIQTIRAGQNSFGAEQPVSAMILIVQMGTPQLAADVANDLARKVLDLTAAKQSARVRETLEFYEGEESRLGLAIAALEAEITSFKNANVDALPEGVLARRDEIGRLSTTLRDLDSQILDLNQELAALTSREARRTIEQRQISVLQAQIAGLEGQRQAVRARQTEVEAAVNRAPMVETQLGTFDRRLQQLHDQYTAINMRRAEAETSQRLDSERQTERFELLESALPPDYPLASGRRKVMVFGVFGSLMVALGLALALELRDPVLRTARQTERALGIRPVIALPDLPGPHSRRASLWRRLTSMALVAGAGAAALAMIAAQRGGTPRP